MTHILYTLMNVSN